MKNADGDGKSVGSFLSVLWKLNMLTPKTIPPLIKGLLKYWRENDKVK